MGKIKSNFNTDIDMSSLTNVITSVEQVPTHTIEKSRNVMESSHNIEKKEKIAIENEEQIEIGELEQIIKPREKDVSKWCQFNIAEEQLEIIKSLKKYSKTNSSLRDIVYNIIDLILTSKNNEINRIIKEVEQEEFLKIQERLKRYE